MKVILLSTIKNLGKYGQIIKVQKGYARNFLLPKNKVILATDKNIKEFEDNKLFAKKKKLEMIYNAKSRIKEIKSIDGSINIYKKSSEKKKIFGSVGIKDIVNALFLKGIKIKENEIQLPNGLLRYLGEHKVIFMPYKNLFIEFVVSIFTKNK